MGVCPQGHLCMISLPVRLPGPMFLPRGLCPWSYVPFRGSLSRGSLFRGDLCPGVVSGGSLLGVSLSRGLWGSLSRGSWSGVSVLRVSV